MHLLQRITAASLFGGAVFFCAAGCVGETQEEQVAEAAPECDCELKSWRVFARGRHLFIDIECPEGYEYLSGRVEFTKASLRTDYTGSPIGGVQFARAPLGRMSKDAILMPFMVAPPPSQSTGNGISNTFGEVGLSGAIERTEMEFAVTPEQAALLQRDRLWDVTYKLFGPNSNSGMRVALTEIGVRLPEHVLESGGALGEFPGVLSEVGGELEIADWGMYGIGAVE